MYFSASVRCGAAWNNGMIEYWNNGRSEWQKSFLEWIEYRLTHHSNFPTFQLGRSPKFQ
jgi:hypothetical protein